jgi:mutator protein MutT
VDGPQEQRDRPGQLQQGDWEIHGDLRYDQAPRTWRSPIRDVVNALLWRDGAVLLARRSARRRSYPGLWSFPGGHVEGRETLEQALIRECREEIGITPVRFELLDRLADPNADPGDPVTYHMYVVTDWDGGEPSILDDEHSSLHWFLPNLAAALPDLALDEYRALMDQLRN